VLSSEEIIRTVEMLKNENLDVRTVTLGISLRDCVSANAEDLCLRIRRKIQKHAKDLVSACDRISKKYGIPIVNKRLAVTPIAAVAESLGREDYLGVARALDQTAEEVGVNFIGGYSALVQKGFTKGDRNLIDTIPEVLSSTERVCASVNAASTRAGINMDALLLMGQAIKETSLRTAERDGFGCAKLVVFAVDEGILQVGRYSTPDPLGHFLKKRALEVRTAQILEAVGFKVQRIFKLQEGRPNALDLLKNREIQLVINTPAGQAPRADEVKIRTTAVYTGTPIMTTISGAKAAALGIAALQRSGYSVETLQEYH